MRYRLDTLPGASVQQRRAFPGWPALAFLLISCQAPPASLQAHAQTEAPPVIPPAPDCASGRTAKLTTGLVVRFAGADHADPSTCLVVWSGQTHRYVLGVVPKARGQKISPNEREAIRAALFGPPGTRAEFDDEQAALWGRVTVEHVADPVLILQGKPRRTAQLRIVRHDASGRPGVRAVTLHWIDLRTGIVLREQVVTEMDDGRQFTSDVWEVESLG